MKSNLLRNIATATALTVAASGATAACEYGGIYYEHGTVICFDGYLQECTVADYWSAVGMCQSSGALESGSDVREFAASVTNGRGSLDVRQDQPASAQTALARCEQPTSAV